MSRIGVLPINVPTGVEVTLSGADVKVKGPKGELDLTVREEITVALDGAQVSVGRVDDTRSSRALHGLSRSLIANMIKGVSEGFEKRLEIVGVGYKAEASGGTLKLLLGFSHPIDYKLPKGITAEVERLTTVILRGYDKQLLGQTAAEVRSFRPPEPYKGKGVKYADETIRRKAGKAGKVGG